MNNSLYYSYADAFDRDIIAIESMYDIDMNKGFLALESEHYLELIRESQVNLKILSENGTVDDMMFLTEASTAEASENKKGIISGMFEAIGKFIKSFIDKIKSLFGAKEEKAFDDGVKSGEITGDVKLDFNPDTLSSKVGSIIGDIVNFVKPGFTSKNEEGKKQFDPLKTLKTAVLVTGGFVISKKALKPAKEKLQKALDKFNAGKDVVAGFVDKTDDTGFAKKILGWLNGIVKFLTEQIGKITKMITSFIPGKKNGSGEAQDGEVVDTNDTNDDSSGDSSDVSADKPKALPDNGNNTKALPDNGKQQEQVGTSKKPQNRVAAEERLGLPDNTIYMGTDSDSNDTKKENKKNNEKPMTKKQRKKARQAAKRRNRKSVNESAYDDWSFLEDVDLDDEGDEFEF